MLARLHLRSKAAMASALVGYQDPDFTFVLWTRYRTSKYLPLSLAGFRLMIGTAPSGAAKIRSHVAQFGSSDFNY